MANKRWAAGSIQVVGLEQVVRELERRGLDVMAGVEAICDAGAQVVEREIAGRAVGRLAEATMRETTQKTARKVTVSVGVQKNLNYIARFQEFGTKEHVIPKAIRRRKKRKALLMPDGSFRYRVRHPGQSKKPFIRPGYDASVDEAQAAMGRRTKQVVRA